MKFTLIRVSATPDGAFGVLLEEGQPFAVTLEPTYIFADSSHEPKIPTGTHRCSRSMFFRGGYETYEIHVSGHSRLLFHKGNTVADSDGCILVAEQFGEFAGKPGISYSAEGFREFMNRAGSAHAFELEVIDAIKARD